MCLGICYRTTTSAFECCEGVLRSLTHCFSTDMEHIYFCFVDIWPGTATRTFNHGNNEWAHSIWILFSYLTGHAFHASFKSISCHRLWFFTFLELLSYGTYCFTDVDNSRNPWICLVSFFFGLMHLGHRIWLFMALRNYTLGPPSTSMD